MRFSNSNLMQDVRGATPRSLVPTLRVGTHCWRCSASLGAWEPGPDRREDATAKRQSLIPNPQSPIPHSRRGFTLVEMLIVIGIMLMLVTAAMTIMPAAGEARRTREAARSVNVYLSTARNRAMETGRPCGVTFRFFAGNPCALNADQCEVPPDYEGQTLQSMAQVNTTSSSMTVNLVYGTNSQAEVLPRNMVRPSDLIQFDHQGVIYSLSGGTDSNGYLTGGTFVITAYDPNPAPPLPKYARAVPFRIFRAPMKSAAESLQLPTSTVVDLDFSGMSNQLGSGAQNLTVMFSSTGAVDSVYYGSVRSSVTDPIYILIGKRERVATFTPVGQVPPATKLETQFTNLEDLNNLWVTINTQTGLINTEPVATGATTAAHDTYVAAKNAGATDAQAHLAAMIAATNAARALAVQGIGMGGK
jgi:prepilin-type N-terminal cleavage/methylation domain-containing protein